jgi:PST family polysaccharide transporter
MGVSASRYERPEVQPGSPSSTVEERTYGRILQSSALMGASSAINVAVAIVRTKVLAALLGPAGLGLMGLYASIVDLAVSVAGMGVSSSGVRQIAAAAGSGDTERIYLTLRAVRVASLVLGMLGAALVAAFSAQISSMTFGSDDYALPVAVLSLAVLLRLIAGGQGAVIQGLRRIRDLAMVSTVGPFLGSVSGVALVYALREDGIALSLVGSALIVLLVTWTFARNSQVPRRPLAVRQIRQETEALLKLGSAFMVSGFLMMGAAYLVRTLTLRMEGAEAAGFYHAAWTLGGLYVMVLLQAMGADFYPRLTAAAGDERECNRLVNEQTQASMLLGAPGVIATLSFAPQVVVLLYSAEFEPAVETLRWICCGMAMRLVTWPMGFVLLARAEQRLFVLTELAWTIVNITLTWFCLRRYGVTGAGIAFFASYVFHGAILYPIVRDLTGFRWWSANLKVGLLLACGIGIVFGGLHLLPAALAVVLGICALIVSLAWSVHRLAGLAGSAALPGVARLLTMLRPLLEREK